jgi:hypothetical protein
MTFVLLNFASSQASKRSLKCIPSDADEATVFTSAPKLYCLVLKPIQTLVMNFANATVRNLGKTYNADHILAFIL